MNPYSMQFHGIIGIMKNTNIKEININGRPAAGIAVDIPGAGKNRHNRFCCMCILSA